MRSPIAQTTEQHLPSFCCQDSCRYRKKFGTTHLRPPVCGIFLPTPRVRQWHVGGDHGRMLFPRSNSASVTIHHFPAVWNVDAFLEMIGGEESATEHKRRPQRAQAFAGRIITLRRISMVSSQFDRVYHTWNFPSPSQKKDSSRNTKTRDLH